MNSSLQRARSAVRADVPRPTQQDTLRDLGDDKVRALVDGYAAAMRAGDVDALLALFHHDATWCMPPMPAWYQGIDAIAGFVADFALLDTWRHLVTSANWSTRARRLCVGRRRAGLRRQGPRRADAA